MSQVRKLVAGNWKMHGTAAQLGEAKLIAEALAQAPVASRVALCPPTTLIHRMSELMAGSAVLVGAQDLHPEVKGAFTGDVSAHMLHDAGAQMVIIGHSERRSAYRESDQLIAAKVATALHVGLEPVVCVGETLEQRKAGEALAVVEGQLAGSLPDALDGKAFAVAYEPVWAIGTGLTPTIEEIEAVHVAIRAHLVQRFANGASVPILYGGSVKPTNAAEILHAREVGGALVGGASLTAADFLPIIRAAG